jgi:biopolymer transport protein ExbB/biopolymer transport protein TolQ
VAACRLMYNLFTNKIESFDVEMNNSASELIDYFLKKRGGKR